MSNVEEVSLFEDDDNPVEQAVEETPEVPDEETKEPSFKVPDKFAGKTFEEVVESYTNLEKDMGRKANEIGELRKLTDDILKQQLEQQQTVVEPTIDDLGFDDFIDDPNQAVNKALENNPRLKKIEEALAKDSYDKAHDRLIEKHQDADAIVGSPEFANWLSQSPSRTRMFKEAHENYDVDLASDLFDMYKSTHKISTEEAIEQRDAKAKDDLKKATVEKGSTNTASKKVYRRAELIRLKIEQPERYAAMSDDIRKAYAEGRVK